MVNDLFMKAVQNKDFDRIRDLLINRFHYDRNCTSGMFNEYWAECEKAGIADSLFQPHDGGSLSDEKSEANLYDQIGALAVNFSRERMEHVLLLARTVWKSEQKPAEKTWMEKLKSLVKKILKIFKIM